MLEIYNESIRDLLRRPGTDAMKLEATTHVFFSSSSVQIFITNTTPKPSDQSPNIDIFGLKFVFVILKLISGGDGNGGGWEGDPGNGAGWDSGGGVGIIAKPK